MNSINTLLYDIVSIDGNNYYLLDKLKIILNEKNKVVGFYNKNYTTISKTEQEIVKYIIDNNCLFFLDFL
jgi:hypothetical protein